MEDKHSPVAKFGAVMVRESGGSGRVANDAMNGEEVPILRLSLPFPPKKS